MKLLEKIGSGVMKKVGLATALMADSWPSRERDCFTRPVYVAPRYRIRTTTGRACVIGMRGLAACGTAKLKGARADKSSERKRRAPL